MSYYFSIPFSSHICYSALELDIDYPTVWLFQITAYIKCSGNMDCCVRTTFIVPGLICKIVLSWMKFDGMFLWLVTTLSNNSHSKFNRLCGWKQDNHLIGKEKQISLYGLKRYIVTSSYQYLFYMLEFGWGFSFKNIYKEGWYLSPSSIRNHYK